MKKKILFVCKHNRFRSKIAEAYFKKINKNRKYSAESAGIIKGDPVDINLISIGKKYGMKISRHTTGLSEKMLREADVMILVANNVPVNLFKKRAKIVSKWNIPDAHQKNKKKVELVSKIIMKKVEKFVEQLK